jgi:hypothetical protein
MKPGQDAVTPPYKSSRRMRVVSSKSGSLPRFDAYAGTTAKANFLYRNFVHAMHKRLQTGVPKPLMLSSAQG